MFWMWTESRGRLPMYLLMGGSGLNVVHACSPLFFFFEKKKKRVQDMLTSGLMDLKFWMLPKGPMDLKFGHASQRSNGFEIWTCFPKV